MIKNKLKNNKAFTIVEAIVAVFILSVSITAMLGLTISSFSSAKYANNELTANYLLQEAVDSIRNSRDTMVFQQGVPWDTFLDEYGSSSSHSSCFNPTFGCNISIGADFDPTNPSSSVSVCDYVQGGNGGSSSIWCPALNFNENATNGSYYSTTGGSASRFKRQIKMDRISADEVEVTATVEYPNGTASKNRTLKMNLLNWKN